MSEPTQRFRYRAATADGRLVDGVLAAPTERAALASLEERSLVPVELTVTAGRDSAARRRDTSVRTASGAWARTVATMLAAGVPLERALTFVTAHASNKQVRQASQQVLAAVQRGDALATAMRQSPAVFSPVVVAMAAAGEDTGALDSTFARMATYFEEQLALRQGLRAALSYPALLAIVASVAVLVLMLFVIPRFAVMLAELGATLPLSTRLLLGVSNLAVGWWWAAALIVLAGGVLVRTSLAHPRRRERWHAARLRLPIAGEIEQGLETGRFLRTVSLLLQSGASVLGALAAGRSAIVNTALGRKLDQAIEDVRRGRTIATSMAGILPPLALELVAAGEESGSLAELAEQAGVGAEDDAQRSLRTIVGFVEPALILFFGLLVGFVALAMLQAIYSVNATTVIR